MHISQEATPLWQAIVSVQLGHFLVAENPAAFEQVGGRGVSPGRAEEELVSQREGTDEEYTDDVLEKTVRGERSVVLFTCG